MTSSTTAVPELRFEVLGSVRVWRGAAEIDCGPARQQALLAILLASAGDLVSMSDLVTILWDGAPPTSAANSVQKFVGKLRRLFEPGLPIHETGHWLIRHLNSYRLNVQASSLDLLRFRELAEQAGRLAAAGQPAEAMPIYLAALGLWHGRCAANIDPAIGSQAMFTRVNWERLVVAVEAANVAVLCGRPGDVLPVLRELSVQHPLDERLHAQLISNLAAAGFQADALAVYRRISDTLAEELGIDPGVELRDAQRKVLRQEAGSRTREPVVPVPEPVVPQPRGAADQAGLAPFVPPAELPPDLWAFTGRRDIMARLDEPLKQGPSTMITTVISGMAGVGKTTLAVHWAHQLAERYPDGQLYVNLRGFDPSGTVLAPEKVLSGFLEALGVPPQRIPDDLAAATALYRSILSGRRVLILLDNAFEVDQVRPLLPASAGCLAIVTTRRQLTGLAVSHGAHMLTLPPFSEQDAREMLVRRLGEERLLAEPEAFAEVVRRCAGLPLAVAIVAARAIVHHQLPVAAIVEELRDERTRLNALGTTETAIDLRAVFSWSYRLLRPQAARVFRLLALHCGPDSSLAATASLAGLSLTEARAATAELIQYQILSEHAAGRFSLHDLIKLYGAELSADLDSGADRTLALERLFDHYVHGAHAAQMLLSPSWTPPVPAAVRPGVVVPQPVDHAEAMAWFLRERQALVAAVKQAAVSGFQPHAWRLALVMQQFLHRQGYWHDWLAVAGVALTAAEELGDVPGRAFAHRSLAGAHHFLGHNDEAIRHLERTSTLFDELGYITEHAYVAANFGSVVSDLGDHRAAIGHYSRALKLFTTMGHESGQAIALERIGHCLGRLGEYQESIDYLEQAMMLYRSLDDRNGEGDCWATLGQGHQQLAELDAAAHCYTRAVALYRELDNRADEAECLVRLGEVQLATRDFAGTRLAWNRALEILGSLQLPLAGSVRTRLAQIEQCTL